MLGFLTPGVLFAAAAALIPLIIHLFSKRRVKIVEFSSLRHLKTMQRRQVRRLKIRQLLLLIVRMLLILAVVLAFARPTTQSSAVGAHAAVSAVIILDNSASMNRSVADGNLFDIAKNQTKTLLGEFSQSDELLILGTDINAGQANDFISASAALTLVENMKVGFSSVTLEQALQVARDQLANRSNLNRELYLLTDRQRLTLPEEKLLADFAVNAYLVDLNLGEPANVGILAVDFGGQLIKPGHEFQLTGTIRNFDSRVVEDRIASLYLDGHRVAQTDFKVEAASQTAVKFDRSVSTPGFHSGWLELSDDKFLPDNKFYFSFRIPEMFNLLVVQGDAGAGYVSLALSPNDKIAQYWSVKTSAPNDLTGVNFDDYDAVMLIGSPKLDEVYINRLKSFVRRGHSVFMSLSGKTDRAEYNRVWSAATGLVYDEAPPREFSRSGFYNFAAVDKQHPIFSVFDLEDSGLPEIKFFALPKTHQVGVSESLIKFSGGRPALVENQYGEGKMLTFAAPFDPTYTDLVGHAFFVPFISRIAEYLASDLSALETRLTVGGSSLRSVKLQSEPNYALELIKPDSSRFAIHPEENNGRLAVRAAPLDLPGLYRIVYLGRELDRFAVNIEPHEGDLAAATPEQMQTALGLEKLTVLTADENLGETLSELRFGRELWQLFIWIALALLIAETILARGGKVEAGDVEA